jgi:hypothetical protein
LQKTGPNRTDPLVWFGLDRAEAGLDRFGLIWFDGLSNQSGLMQSLYASSKLVEVASIRVSYEYKKKHEVEKS